MDRDIIMKQLGERIFVYDDKNMIKYDINMTNNRVILTDDNFKDKIYKISEINNKDGYIVIKFKTFTQIYIIEITQIPKMYKMINLDNIRAQVRIYKRKIFKKNGELVSVNTHHIGLAN